MSDGLPSFAPQWLRSGGSSGLGAGTTGSAAGPKGDGSKVSTWRESGSRLGFGAGTDRDATHPAESKQAGSSSRRPGGAAQDRSKGFSADRAQGFRRGNARLLSDRELVEQTSSLKLKSGAWAAGDGSAPELSYQSGVPAQRKNGERSFNNTRSQAHRSNGRKVSGANGGSSSSQRSAPVHPRTPERDFTGLSRNASLPAVVATNPRLRTPPSLSPRGDGDSPWGALAPEGGVDVSPAALGQAPEVSTSSASSVAVAEPAVKTVPRMADAILQAQETVAQEAAKAAKARIEQLNLRQSKQLVPVLASVKPKHAGTTPSAPASLAPQKKPSGLEPLGRPGVSTAASLTRKDEDAAAGSKRTPPPGSNPAVVTSPHAPAAGAKPARERDRLAFFGSLRRKTSGGESAPGGDSAPSGEQSHLAQSRTASDVASELSRASPKGPPDVAEGEEAVLHVPPSPAASEARAEAESPGVTEPTPGMNGSPAGPELLPEMTPEEAAFMRSLGWEETPDDAEGGLTEEEVAGFWARYPDGNCKASVGPATSLKQSAAAHPTLAPYRTFRSELEFSDSDAD